MSTIALFLDKGTIMSFPDSFLLLISAISSLRDLDGAVDNGVLVDGFNFCICPGVIGLRGLFLFGAVFLLDFIMMIYI